MITQLVTSATGEPISLEEIKLHLRIEEGETAEDDLLNGLVGAARESVENYTNRKLMPQTWYVYYDDFPSSEYYSKLSSPNPNPHGSYFKIPYPPLRSVPSSGLHYTNSSGASTTLSSTKWSSDTKSIPGRLVLGYNEEWPSNTLAQNNPIRIEFNAGYAGSTAIPNSIKTAIKMMVGSWYENRESMVIGQSVVEIPNTVRYLLSSYRVF